jgi:hypothetical protein
MSTRAHHIRNHHHRGYNISIYESMMFDIKLWLMIVLSGDRGAKKNNMRTRQKKKRKDLENQPARVINVEENVDHPKPST